MESLKLAKGEMLCETCQPDPKWNIPNQVKMMDSEDLTTLSLASDRSSRIKPKMYVFDIKESAPFL
jgi:hypothetical protein